MGHGWPLFGLARCAVIVVLWLAIRFCGLVKHPPGKCVELLTRNSGLLSAIAVQLVAEVVRAFVKQG